MCTCTAGTKTEATGATPSTLCETNGAEDCSACLSGYHGSNVFGPGNQVCEKNVCTCADGVASTYNGASDVLLCEAHDSEDCAVCTTTDYVLKEVQGSSGIYACQLNCTDPFTHLNATGNGCDCNVGYYLDPGAAESCAAGDICSTCAPNSCSKICSSTFRGTTDFCSFLTFALPH